MRTIYTSIVIFLIVSTSFSAKANTYTYGDANLTIQGLTVKFDAVKKVNTIHWASNNTSVNYFIVESSSNGVDFKTIGYVFAGDVENYSFKNTATGKVTYRVIAIHTNDTTITTSIVE